MQRSTDADQFRRQQPGLVRIYAGAGAGSYGFYTVATDKAGNTEAAPGRADAVTVLDLAPPSSSTPAPARTSATTVIVNYTATDGASGVATVDLWVKAPGESSYSKAGSDIRGSGSFNYTAKTGDGSYEFYTVATDKAGNAESAPDGPDASVVVSTMLPDTTAQSSSARAPASVKQGPITVSFTASGSSVSALARVDLYAKSPGGYVLTTVVSDTSDNATGTWSYVPAAGSGTYAFSTLATDKAGNVSACRRARTRAPLMRPAFRLRPASRR